MAVIYTSDGRSKMQDSIDSRIEELDSEKRQLFQQRNALSNISCLPDEILGAIFSLYAQSYSGMSTSLRWVRNFNVCRVWREVSLACPTIWTNIPLSSSAWTEAMLARSKNAPISVRVRVYRGGPNKKNLQLALKHIHRIAELTIEDTCDALETYCCQMTEPALLLQSLVLKGTDQGYKPVQSPQLFQGSSPQLRRLETHFLLLGHWNTSLYHNLTHLIVHNYTLKERPTMPQILSIFSQSPRLVVLELIDALPTLPLPHESATPLSIPSPAPASIFTLESLIKVVIQGSVQDVAFLCSQFRTSPTASFFLTCNETDALGSEVSIMYPIVQTHKGRGKWTPMLVSLFMNPSEHENLVISGHRTTKYCPISTASPGGILLDLKAKMNKAFTTQQLITISKDILGSFDLSHVRVLQIFDLPAFDSKALINLYRLEELVLDGSATYNIVRALTIICQQERGRGLLVPQLLKLRLYGVDFCTKHKNSTFFEILRDTLMTRSWYRCQVETVSIETCKGFSEFLMDLIGELVTYVDWDYDDGESEEEEDDEDEWYDQYGDSDSDGYGPYTRRFLF